MHRISVHSPEKRESAVSVGQLRGRDIAAHLVAYSLEVQYSQRRNAPCKPFAIPFLFPDGVPEQGKELKFLRVPEWLKVSEFRYIVVCKYECR